MKKALYPRCRMNENKIYCENCLDTLTRMPDNYLDCVVTSPPYWGLRDYGLQPSIWGAQDGCLHEWGAFTTDPVHPVNRRCSKCGRFGVTTRTEGENTVTKCDNCNELLTDSKSSTFGVNSGDEKWIRSIEESRKTKMKQVNQGQHCVKCSAWHGNLGLEPTPELYVQHIVKIFSEIKRALKPEGTVWLNLGDSYSGSHGTGGKPGDKQHTNAGSGSMNSRPEVPVGLKPKDLVGVPWAVAFALRSDGWYLRSDIIWHKPNPMPESVTDRPTKSHEYIFLLTKSAKYYYDMDAIREPASNNTHERQSRANINTKRQPTDKINAIRTPKAQRVPSGWDTGKGNHRGKIGRYPKIKNNPSFDAAMSKMPDTRNKRSVWTVTTKPFKEAHFATYPPDLIRPCILAGCPVGGIVYDPFMGSGTTAEVAILNKRKYIGSELNPEYIKLSEKRLGLFK